MLAVMKPWKPSEETPFKEEGAGMWDIDVEEAAPDRISSYIV
jgi:hypothetical protein